MIVHVQTPGFSDPVHSIVVRYPQGGCVVVLGSEFTGVPTPWLNDSLKYAHLVKRAVSNDERAQIFSKHNVANTHCQLSSSLSFEEAR